jgi:hypothetical protein
MSQANDLHYRLCELLDGGDWACSFGQCGTLSSICQELIGLLDDPELSEKARLVAREVTIDMGTATRRWAELAYVLRHPAVPAKPRLL